MSYEELHLGSTYSEWGKPIRELNRPKRAQQTPGNPTDPNREPMTASLGDMNPFWVGARLLCIETLVECLR